MTKKNSHVKKQPSWKQCENSKKHQDKERGCTIIPTGIGSDYARFCSGEKPTLVEVKEGCGNLSKTQSATKKIVERMGWNYQTERCNCDSK